MKRNGSGDGLIFRRNRYSHTANKLYVDFPTMHSPCRDVRNVYKTVEAYGRFMQMYDILRKLCGRGCAIEETKKCTGIQHEIRSPVWYPDEPELLTEYFMGRLRSSDHIEPEEMHSIGVIVWGTVLRQLIPYVRQAYTEVCVRHWAEHFKIWWDPETLHPIVYLYFDETCVKYKDIWEPYYVAHTLADTRTDMHPILTNYKQPKKIYTEFSLTRRERTVITGETYYEKESNRRRNIYL